MKTLTGLALVCVCLAADDSFITQYEYGEMLYKNPRGIGCDRCHGRHGEGAVIARYKEDGKPVELKGPDIRHLSIAALRESLEKRHRVMPTYFLTRSETEALHYFLTHKPE
ncbi:cytochrome c [Hydrogenimonas sp. SS33]|uniref:c-type cytochrome n=1 Tax=Hydrogenimonas leucolamina TaxID=2954236 RepID=UPI00336BEBF6